MHGVGTEEPYVEEPYAGLEEAVRAETGRLPISRQWRKPLRIDEVARLAPTHEVKQRPGRP